MKFVRLHVGKQKLEAVLEVAGKHRKIQYTWKTREKSDVPPAGWLDQVMEEARQQHGISGNRIRWLVKK